jgi:hypothetical protein
MNSAEGRDKINKVIARCRLLSKQQGGQGIEGMSFCFDPEEVESMLTSED